MTDNKKGSDSDFCLPFSSSVPAPCHHHHQNPKPRRKRTQIIEFESRLIPSATPCSAATISCSSSSSSSTAIGLPTPKNYVKKPDPSAPKITRPCSECGKRFWSWKALYGHMRCHPERQWRGINPPPNHHGPISPIQQFTVAEEAVMTADDHDVAESLLLLANSVDATTPETECADYGGVGATNSPQVQEEEEEEEEGSCRFECSSCKKVFGSHQALGGHRATHKNVKGCFAITRSDGCEVIEDHSGSGDAKRENAEDGSVNHKKVMVSGNHQCSICLRVFSSGQALGGHKRCHWEKGEEASSSMTGNHQGLNVVSPKDSCGLDLNLPAPIDEESSSSYSSGLTLDLRLGL